MSAYYNEFDPKAAAWLRELIKAGLIADGTVDERSISDVAAADTRGFTQVHFFAGIGGWSYALRLAGWADDRQVWTGSCPCQPFSLAGAQKGFTDARHLWPDFRRLIAECRPATVFGEQVASATEWLRLVRSDLEALDYAVGAIPVQAASAGADHLRDRFWFVGHDTRDGWREGRPEHEVRSGWPAITGTGGPIDLGDASGARLAFRSIAEVQRGNVRGEGAPTGTPGDRGDGLAHANEFGAGEGRQQRSGEQRGAGGDPQSCLGDVADGAGQRRQRGENSAWTPGRHEPESDHAWVIGADGKARRVKPGVRLLANGFPSRVGLLRGFGNAIDPRPASAFIRAAMT